MFPFAQLEEPLVVGTITGVVAGVVAGADEVAVAEPEVIVILVLTVIAVTSSCG